MKVYSFNEIHDEIEILKDTFEIVRLVNPIMGNVVKNDESGKIIPTGCFCFEAWSKNTRCKNCISSLVLSNHKKASKLEYIDGVLYYIISKYVVVEGYELVLEAVSRFDRAYTESIFDEDSRAKELIRLYKQTGVDELTGLYNRRFLRTKLSEILTPAESSSTTVGVIILDIDRLKTINVTNGRFAGDAVISAVADVIHSAVSYDENSFVARIGGDEFAVVSADTDYDTMKSKCDKILNAIDRTDVNDYPMIKVSACAGGALSSECVGYSELISLADRRLYKAKMSDSVKVLLQ